MRYGIFPIAYWVEDFWPTGSSVNYVGYCNINASIRKANCAASVLKASYTGAIISANITGVDG